MLHIILLSTLAIISKSMVTSHARCGATYIFEPALEACCNNQKYALAVEACCNNQKYAFGTQSCCNGAVVNGRSCVNNNPNYPMDIPMSTMGGSKLIIRSDYVNQVDAEVDAEVDVEDDAGGDTNDGQDDTTDGNDDGGDTTDDGNDTGDDTGDDNDNDDDNDDEEGDAEVDDNDDDGDDNDDDNDDDDDDAFVDGNSNDDDDDNETESAEGETDQSDGDGDLDEEGALYGNNGDNSDGFGANNKSGGSFNDMDYYVKITLINMWLILGLIVIVNIIFYWCYCRKQNQRNKMNRVQSNMYVDDPTVGQLTDDDHDDNV